MWPRKNGSITEVLRYHVKLPKYGSVVGEEKGVHRLLVGKPEGKMPLGRPRRRWENNIKMIIRKLEGVVGTGWSWLRIGTGGGHL
jgi:hypothetical protein